MVSARLTLAETLARFAAEASPDAAARTAGRRTLVNTVAVAVGGSRSEATELALRVARELGPAPEAQVVGRADRLATRWAAFVNGVSAHVDDFDDTHFETIVHPGAAVVPAALASAETGGTSSADLVDAVVVGVEIALRLGLTVYPAAFDKGWHMSGIVGPIGAAAAAGRALGLDRSSMRYALSRAAVQGAGTQEALGTMTKSFHLGKAAANGLEAAVEAKTGLTGPPEALDGFPRLFSGDAALPERAVRDLGTVWEIERNAFKPYSCGVVSHAAIDGAIQLRREGCDWRAVARVEVRTNPVVLDVMGVREPDAELPAKFSVYHCVAVGLRDGAAGPPQFADRVVRDPELVALRHSVEVTLDPTCRVDESTMTAILRDGSIRSAHIEHARSSAAAPLSDEDLREKAHTAADGVLGREAVDRLVGALFSDTAPSELAALTVP